MSGLPYACGVVLTGLISVWCMYKLCSLATAASDVSGHTRSTTLLFQAHFVLLNPGPWSFLKVRFRLRWAD